MKKSIFIIALTCAALLSGCAHEEPANKQEQVRVRLSGTIAAGRGVASRGDGRIDPRTADLLPTKQLTIGVLTIEYDPVDKNDPEIPAANTWAAGIPYLDRAIFGGNEIGDSPGNMADGGDWNGNIAYTNRAGTALQHAFYRLTGTYFYFVALHPYAAIENPVDVAAMTDNGGISVTFNMDGSHDVMATNVGYGNIKNPWAYDTFGDKKIPPDELKFLHKLACLDVRFVAENKEAGESYGDIIKVEVIDQPSQVKLNIGNQAHDNGEPLRELVPPSPRRAYDAYRGGTSGGLALPYPSGTATPEGYGYFLVMPSQTYTFRITASAMDRPTNPIEVTYDFGGVTVVAGTIYYLTFKMLETHQIDIQVATSTEWLLDQGFN